jgi:hypothetical protein
MFNRKLREIPRLVLAEIRLGPDAGADPVSERVSHAHPGAGLADLRPYGPVACVRCCRMSSHFVRGRPIEPKLRVRPALVGERAIDRQLR